MSDQQPRGWIFYRLQVHMGDTWANEWFSTQAEGMTALRRCREQKMEAHLDECEIPRHKDGLLHALNCCDYHRMNWEVGPTREIGSAHK